MSSYSPRSDDMGIVYLAVLGAAALLAWYVWDSYHATIAYYGLRWTWMLLGLVDFPWMPQAVSEWRQETAAIAAQAQLVPLGDLIALMDRAGYLFVGIPLALTFRGIVTAGRHRANLTRRRIDATNLPWIMAKHAPAVIPALYYGDEKTQLLNVDPPEHRSSLNPEEWVARHGLLVNGKLDRRKARLLLIEDLGRRITSIDELHPHERALFAVFSLRLFPGSKDREQAQDLLDALNRSCHRGTHDGKRGYPEFAAADDAFATAARHEHARKWIAKHPYPRTLLHAMHKEALLTGALASSHFRWLKGIDRGLWYALNTTGRKTPFMESAAVFTQTQWEEFAQDCGYELREPYLDDALNGVESYLVKIGLMDKPQ